MLENKWKNYASSWSQSSDQRNSILKDIVADNVTYCDPNSMVTGRDAFAAHMEQFQQDVPGAYFEIIGVKDHHDKTLAQWRLCGKDGGEMMLGTSFAELTSDGKFASFTGFF